ncbi:predicted protein [Lichtheimia corymbifera JMRC:FSU:9682]|uniref:Uncharacterized protein n=1 Tax=Lichtheimia corymbifera JMRC:FSU:9682 TaxID=1263082 RepID=A0A068SEX3_9FUNG|nr:predicted protein [Lichtheimia corymbifera JMRC:FSU:9682]
MIPERTQQRHHHPPQQQQLMARLVSITVTQQTTTTTTTTNWAFGPISHQQRPLAIHHPLWIPPSHLALLHQLPPLHAHSGINSNNNNLCLRSRPNGPNGMMCPWTTT